MSSNTGLVTLSETEFEHIKAKLTDPPKEPYARMLAIAQAINDIGIRGDRLDTVFHEVCERL